VPKLASCLQIADFSAEFWNLTGGGVEMTTLWVETRAGHLTEGFQVSEGPASSEDGSRAHLFPGAASAPGNTLSPTARLRLRGCVCPSPQTSSRA
jgi:hypothetical protein